jgi:hypothetical protein
MAMEDRELKKNHLEPDGQRETYEPPEATVVRIELQERMGGCNFSTIQVCGLTEP